MVTRPPERDELVIYRVVLLAATAFALSLALGTASPTPTIAPTAVPTSTPMPTSTPAPMPTATPIPAATAMPTATSMPTATALPTATLVPTPIPLPTPASTSRLPATVPGSSRDEGVFLVTSADDGTQAAYFIAANLRHSIQWDDVQTEMRLNPLWPVRWGDRDEVLAFAEGGPIGIARVGLLTADVPAPVADVPAPPVADVPAQPVANAPAEPVAYVPTEPVADLAAPVIDAPASAQTASVYVLRAGDNLTHIAAQYGTTINAILAANSLTNANRIYAGQALTIPSPGAASLAEAPAASATDVVDEAEDAPTTYVVKPGDSAIHIARQFGIDEAALLEANSIVNPNRVYVGQTLTIPTPSS